MLRLELHEPCTAPWGSMLGNDSARHCSTCNKTVFELSRGTERLAIALFRLHGASPPCVRYLTNPDGTVLFNRGEVCPCAAPWGRPIALAMLFGLSACSTTPISAHAEQSITTKGNCTIEPIGGLLRPTDDSLADPQLLPSWLRAQCEPVETDTSQDFSMKGRPSLNQCSLPQLGILFDRNQATIRPSNKPALDDVAEVLRTHPHLKTIVIRGHAATDEISPKQLSLDRAMTVQKYLQSRGILATRLLVEGWGVARAAPIGTSETDINTLRRVEFEVLESCAP